MKKRILENKESTILCHMTLDSQSSTDELGNAITYHNSPQFSAGRNGNGLSSGDAYCKLDDANLHDWDFTLSAWIKVVSRKGEEGAGIRLNTTPTAACQIGFNVNYSNTVGNITMLRANSSGTSWSDYLTFMGNIPIDDQFHKVVMAYKSKVLSVYVDDVKTYSASITFEMNKNNGSIGVISGNQALVIDDVMLFEGAD